MAAFINLQNQLLKHTFRVFCIFRKTITAPITPLSLTNLLVLNLKPGKL